MKLVEKSNYANLLAFLTKVNINHYFAKSVLKQHAKGVVYVDNKKLPSSFYIASDYGMSLLFGKSDNSGFNQQLKEYLLNTHQRRKKDEWLQVYPSQWNKVVAQLCGNKLLSNADNNSAEQLNCIVQNTRINFEFDKDRFKRAIANHGRHPEPHAIRTIDKNLYQQLDGVVVPKHFWQSAEHFAKYGKGFVLIVNNEIASTAYSATVDENSLEIGIETNQAFRGNGYAFTICRKIIEHCLANKLLPVWACKLENTASYLLAQKLGFTVSKELPYYRLSRNS